MSVNGRKSLDHYIAAMAPAVIRLFALIALLLMPLGMGALLRLPRRIIT